MSETPRILLYALVAGLSPLALLSTLAVLGSGRGRTNGSAFGLAFLLAQSTVLLIAILVGSASTPDRERAHQTLAASLELTLGAGLLVLAMRGRRPRSPRQGSGESRTSALLARLRGLRPATAVSFGALLGVGGVKRLTITLLAGATIAVAGLIPAEDAGLAVLYVLVAGLLVWVPVAVYLIAGSRADELAETTEAWLVTNQQQAMFVSTLVFGLFLVLDALVRLV
ncbi:MAG: GAP family protein [Gaiellaceae bacterium]